LGRDRIAQAMTTAGAILQNGRWHYQGKPVVLKFVIRTEDERRDIGDTASNFLERVGFTVERLYRDFGPAIQMVYRTDPASLEWHLYTEGWAKVTGDRWDYSTANQMAAPWQGNMPGWLEEGFWQYQNPKADEVGKRLYRGEFQSLEERNTLYRELLEASLEDSIRIWLVVVLNAFPTGDQLTGITEDIAAGPRNLWTNRAAYMPGRDTLRIGNLNVWTASSIWNTVGGFSDIFSVEIWRNLSDPATWRHPGSAQPIPFRATYQVETAGPQGKLPVPSDAFLWDAKAREFRKVAPGTQAISKVTLDLSRYFQSRWHHGQPIAMADLAFSLYQGFDIAFNEKKSEVETAVAAQSKPVLETIKGYRVLDNRRLETYIDYWHFDKDYIAGYVGGFTSTPWELDAAADHLVFTKRSATYSQTAGQRFSLPALSLVLKDHVTLVRQALLELRNQRFVPEPLRGSGPVSVTPEEAVARYDAALRWIEERNLAMISNGPFRLVRFDPQAQFAELEAFRDPTYPFRAKDWYQGPLHRIDFIRLDVPSLAVGAAGDVRVRLNGPEPLHLRYAFLEGGTNRVLQKGEAEVVAAGSTDFRVVLPSALTASLSPGLYHIHFIAYSDLLAEPAERVVDLTIGAPRPSAPSLTASSGVNQSDTPWAAILGGAIGGVLLVTLAVLVLLWALRRRHLVSGSGL
jgi:peptide/nickel transport system substrate-binding protein